MKRGLNIWLLVITAVFAASWYFGRGGTEASDPGPVVTEATREEPVAPVDYSGGETEVLIHLRVLNGTPRGGLARDFSLLLGRAGCVAESVDNAPHDRFDRSLLINRRLDDGQARELARRLGGLPILKEWDGRTSEDAVLVLGQDHAMVREGLEKAAGQVK